MSTTPEPSWTRVGALLLALLLPALAGAGAARTVDERRPADPQGSVDVRNVAGRVEVVGWDRAEVQVTGTLGPGVERLDVSGANGRTEVHVVLPQGPGRGWTDDGAANLVVRVPARSALTATLVSADLVVHGVTGRGELKTVSGGVAADVAREMRVQTVSGDVSLTGGAVGGLLEVRTVSGDVQVQGGAGGEVAVTSVSGDARLKLGLVSRARFKSTSGGLRVDAGLAPDGRLEAESISGDVQLDFAGRPSGEFDVETLSGDITNCFGPKAVAARFGPGSHLSFRDPNGRAQVRVDTKSGDVRLCAH